MTTSDVATQETCANCGARVSTRGRKPARLGKRYCVKPECRRAKQKALYAAREKSEPRDAPTECANCGKNLDPRRWRSEDALGRFCNRVACRHRKVEVREQAAVTEELDRDAQIRVMQNAIMILTDAVYADDSGNLSQSRIPCPECGLTNALSGWAHPDQEGRACLATLDGAEPRKIGPEGLAAYGRRQYDPKEEA